MSGESRARVTVCYLAGTGRSGSTVLANACGQIDGWFSAGEMRFLWQRGIETDRLCGCGEPFSRCETWAKVLDAAFAGSPPDARRIHDQITAATRVRRLPAILGAQRGAKTAQIGPELADVLGRLYTATAETTASSVVVDSSKLPSYAWLLSQVPAVDLHVVHLVRDPRAAAWSWLRKKELPDNAAQAHMERISPLKSSLLWDVWNATTDRLWPGPNHLLVRYEDFVADPRTTMSTIAELCGDPDAELAFTDPQTVLLAPTHTVAGNPDRLRSGPTRLRLDDEWRTRMGRRDRAIVSATTAPLRRRYGYTDDSVTAERLPHEASRLARTRARVLRHVHWGRTQGFGRLVEEDNLDPVERIRIAVSKARWRGAHGVEPGTAVPVWLVGVQRSGTNMVVRGFETSPEFEVHNENDRKVFERFELRSDSDVAAVIAASRHRYVLFKPLCDSHRTPDLLDGIGTGSPGRAIWAYRGVDGRVRSAVAKFGDVNRKVLARIAAGTGSGLWQARRLSDASRELIESFDYGELTPEDGAALFWLVRNRLYFELGLDDRPDTTIVNYDALVAEPEQVMEALCRFLDFPYRPGLVDHVEVRSAGREKRLDLQPRIREACEDLQARLDAAASAR